MCSFNRWTPDLKYTKQIQVLSNRTVHWNAGKSSVDISADLNSRHVSCHWFKYFWRIRSSSAMVLSCTILLSPKPKKLVCVMTVLLESIRKSSRRYGGERDLAFGCNDDSFLGFQFNFEIVAQNWIFRDWIISDSIWIWSSKRNVSTTLLLVRGCTVHHRHSKKGNVPKFY